MPLYSNIFEQWACLLWGRYFAHRDLRIGRALSTTYGALLGTGASFVLVAFWRFLRSAPWTRQKHEGVAAAAVLLTPEQGLGANSAIMPIDPPGYRPMMDFAFMDIAIYDGALYAVCRVDNCIYRRGLLGDAAWARVSNGRIRAIAIHESIVFGVDLQGRVCKQSLNTMTATSPWTRTSKGRAIAVAVAVDVIYIIGEDYNVYAQQLASMTCETKWRLVATGPVRWLDVDGRCIYGVAIRRQSARVLKQQLATMKTNTSWGFACRGYAHALTIHAGRIYVIGGDDHLYFQDLEGMDSSSAWTKSFKLAPLQGFDPGTRFGEFVMPSVQVKRRSLDRHLRLVCISDTHGWHRNIELPRGDILIHAGDITQDDSDTGIVDLAAMFDELKNLGSFRHIVAVGGNHDMSLDSGDDASRISFAKAKLLSACTYLEDEEAVLGSHNGQIRIYGSPWTPQHTRRMAFNLPLGSQELSDKWHAIPDGVDVLVSHGPPFGRRDLCRDGRHVGCFELFREVTNRVKPRLMVFGHIHEAYGVSFDGYTLYVNAASKSGTGKAPLNLPIVVDLPLDHSLPPILVTPLGTS